ncbi:hypothetical protein ACH4CD_32210 [Streptomyces fungicidicus]|uniref:hypothetical protein n=1 Tax=Streptomyces fungicidicus TaxID=68203 RepID=UPI00379D1872
MASPGGAHTPEADDVVQAEAAEAAAAVHKAQRNAARAVEFQALRELGTRRGRPNPGTETKPCATS